MHHDCEQDEDQELERIIEGLQPLARRIEKELGDEVKEVVVCGRIIESPGMITGSP